MKKTAKNIVTIGIGGSYEGPKLFLESFGILDLNTSILKSFMIL